MKAALKFFHHTTRRHGEPISLHSHHCYELVYYLRGKGRTCVGESEYHFQPNEFAVIRPFTLHDERHHEETEVLFTGFSCTGPVPNLSEGIFTDIPGQPIKALLQRMAAEMRQQQTYYTDMLNALLSELLILLARGAILAAPAEQTCKIQYAQSFIDENFTQKIDFPALSRQSGYSYDRFRHLFTNIAGCPPTSYILRKRIEHARILLAQSTQKIAVIALECGFSNDAQFCSLFKRETGVTPGEYRRSVQR